MVQQRINQRLKQIDVFVHEQIFKKIPQLQQVQKKIDIRPAFLVVGLAAFVALFVLFGVGASPLCNLVGFVYPLYASYKAIKSETKKDDEQWLTYWIVYGFFTLLESFTDFFLNWIPFYFLLKLGFLVWCMHPSTQGASTLFRVAIDPLFHRFEERIDQGVAQGAKTAENLSRVVSSSQKQDN